MVETYDPDCVTDSRLFVNGSRVPAGDLDLFVRKEGALDLTRYVEGSFFSPFHGEDYAELFNGLTPDDQESFDTVHIDVLDHATGNYANAFRGIVTGVGNTSGMEKEWRFRARGPGHLMDKVPASKTFGDAEIRTVLGYVAEELREKLPFPLDVPEEEEEEDSTADEDVRDGTTISEEFTVQDNLDDAVAGLADYGGDALDGAADVLTGEPISQAGAGEGLIDIGTDIGIGAAQLGTALQYGTDARVAGGMLNTPKQFQRNRDTLADVISWLQDKTQTRIWLNPTEDGVGFVVTDSPTAGSHKAHYLDDGDTVVMNNDALVELEPANTLEVKGQAKESVGSVGAYQINEPSDTYVTAKARHQTLYERAGQTELHADVDSSTDAIEKGEVEREAKSRLKEAIDGTTEGDMQTLLRAPIKPYDTVDALPTCDEQVATNMEPITYEVQRVHHEITASGISETKLNVGVHSRINEDIEIIDSWEEEA